MGEIIRLREKSRFKFTIEYLKYNKEVRKGVLTQERIVIILKDTMTDREIVHPFTSFLWNVYNGKGIKTVIDYGRNLTVFLNDIINNPREYGNIKNFADLEYEHATIFLNFYCRNLKRSTAKKYKKVISDFYYYLMKKKLLNNCHVRDEEVRIIGDRAEIEFPKLELPTETVRNRNEHDMHLELQALLLEIAFEEVNRIALGVALQMFGGLRLGELINLTYSKISTIGPYGRYGLSINIKNDNLREDLKNNEGKGYAKRIRLQQVLSPFGLLEILFRQHIQKYKINNCDALFINSDNKPMSYSSYRYYFNKLKKKFLDVLRMSENPILKSQFLVLESKRWSTHIGRGIFSNNVLNFTDNPTQLQVMRGDLNPNSAIVYVGDSKRIANQFEENSQELYEKLAAKFNKLRE